MAEENENNHKSRNNDCYKMNKINDDVKKTEQPTASKKRNRKEIAVFGNYRNYYGYRVGQELDEDPRLKVMNREFFEGKDCLDIGCNSGVITIAIAKKFGCRSILGIDIDGARIEDAHWTLRKVIKTNMHRGASKIHKSSEVEFAKSLENNATESRTEDAKRYNSSYSSCAVETDLLKIVSFQKGNFVQGWYPPENTHYDTILCLSVTKWIHLNWGDDGLITLFRRVWTLLQQGGVFIVEPQPWSSYYNNRQVSETTATNYKNILIRPEDFQDVLLDKIGFRRVENITSCLSGTSSGFDRPILAFWK